MTINKKYIITTHNNPKQLKRLLNILNDTYSTFYIHVDLKSDVEDFKKEIKNENVIFINERIDCIWGDLSQVIATINLLRNATKFEENIDNTKIIFLSSNDYLIKKIDNLNTYLLKNKDFEFISFQFEDKILPKKHPNYISRVESYKYNFSSKRGDYLITKGFISENFIGKILLLKFLLTNKIKLSFFIDSFFKRKSIFNNHFKGPNWFSLNQNTAKKILNYIDQNNKTLFKYYKYTLCADEQFFHTVLEEIIKKDTSIKIKPYLHFIDWDRQNVPLPVTFTSNDFNLLVSQPDDKFFARKFDVNLDSNILDMLDKNIV